MRHQGVRVVLTLLTVAVLGWPPLSDARITRIEMTRIESPTFGGMSFGSVGQGCDHAGQKIDFKRTKAERQAAGDPRLSIEERYLDHGAYASAVTRAASDLRQQRLLLDEDVQRYIDAAARSGVGK